LIRLKQKDVDINKHDFECLGS